MHLLVHTYIVWTVESDDLLLYTPTIWGLSPILIHLFWTLTGDLSWQLTPLSESKSASALILLSRISFRERSVSVVLVATSSVSGESTDSSNSSLSALLLLSCCHL